MKRTIASFLKFPVKAVIKVLFRVKTINFDKLDMNGRVIIMPNHPSFLDGLFLYLFLPKEPVFVVNTHIAQKFSSVLKLVNYVTIDPLNSYSMKTIINTVKNDIPVVFFPEGRITTTTGLMKMYDGLGYVALKTGATLYPMILNGPEYSKFSRIKDKVKSKWFPEVKIFIDNPVDFGDEQQGDIKNTKVAVSEKILDIMQTALFNSRYEKDVNLFNELLSIAGSIGGKTEILADSNQQLTYKKLILVSYILSRKLKSIIGKEKNVGILLPNANAHVSVLFCLFYLNKTPAILNFSAGIQNVMDCAETAGFKTVLTSREFIEKGGFGELIENLEKEHEIVYLEDLKKTINLSDKLNGMLSLITGRKATSSEQGHIILFTSGSEGKPKGVVLTHSNILANVTQISCVIDFHSEDKMFNALPMFHSFGLTAGTLLPILSGMPTFLYPSPLHFKVIPELSYEVNATIILGTSTFLAGWGKYAHPYDFYSVRYVIAGGEKLKEDVRNLWQEKFGLRILEGYGCTELSPVISLNTPLCYQHGSVGRVLPGIDYKLEKIDGIKVGRKLLIKGPNLMKGYLLHGRGFVPVGEWYDTGDVVDMDELGYILIKSRLKRFAKISGEMVSLNLIEELAKRCFEDDGNYAAITVNDPKKGEKVILVTTDNKASVHDFKEYLKENRYSMLMSPAKIVCIEQVPVLGSGKTDYVTLTEVTQDKLKTSA